MADFGTDEWLAQANRELTTMRCPRCGRQGTCTVANEMRTGGPFALAGAQMKLSMIRGPVMRCANEDCGLVAGLHED